MKHKTKKLIYNILAVTLVGAGLFYVTSKFVHLGSVEYTDNSQIRQLIVPVNSRVSGFVKEIRFNENQLVKKGDTLALIEDAEYLLRVAQAEADYQNALAGKQIVSSSVETAQNNILVSGASLAEVRALLQHAEKDLERYKNLLAEESVTRQEYNALRRNICR